MNETNTYNGTNSIFNSSHYTKMIYVMFKCKK